MRSKLKQLLQTPRQRFRRLCQANDLQLDYALNRDGFPILKSIFQAREYADYFPFYQNVNILDIGGHYGYFSLFAQQHTGPDAQIVTLEPDLDNQRILRANLSANQADKVQLIGAAVGAKAGQQPLFKGASTNHSLLEENSQSSGAAARLVEVIPLAMLIRQLGWSQVDFLKLDCEGAEYDILLNLPDTTYDQLRIISMEFHDLKRADRTAKALIQRLRQAGFEIVVFRYSPSNLNLNYGRLVAVKPDSVLQTRQR